MGDRLNKVIEQYRGTDTILEALSNCCGEVAAGCGEKCLARSIYLDFKEAANKDELEQEVLLSVENGLMPDWLAEAILRKHNIELTKLDRLLEEMERIKRIRKSMEGPSL